MTVARKAIIYYGGFEFRGGGAFMHAQLLRDELERAGWAVRLITLEHLPLPVRYLPHVVSKVLNWFNAPLGFHYKGRVTRFLYKRLFDDPADLRIFEDIYLAWNSKTPSVTVLHAVWSDNLQGIEIRKNALPRLIAAEERAIDAIAHPIVTVSEPYRQLMINTHRGSRRLAEVEVVPLGLDMAAFAGAPLPERAAKSLVYCGALEPRKNVGFLLEVFRALHAADPDYSLSIIGNGPDEEKLAAYVAEHRLPVTFLGRFDRAAVIAELPRHSAYVHPSVKESFSFALLEAKVSGLTTIAYEGLEVPDEFIDVPVKSFDTADWVKAVQAAGDAVRKPVDTAAYSTERMMRSTLRLAFEDAGRN